VEEKREKEELLELAESFSPRIEATPEALYLDLHPRCDEAQLAAALREKARERGLHIGVGIGSNKLVAHLAAQRASAAPVIVRNGDEARFLSSFTVDMLTPAEELAQTLSRWGIRTLGDLAKLPSEKMITYLGKDGWELQQAACGIDHRPFLPFQRIPIYLEKVDFEWALSDMEPLLFYARPLLERLTAHLRRGGLACQRLEITLRLDPDGETRRSIRLRSPTDDPTILERLFQGQLVARPPEAPLTGLTFVAHPDQPRPAQLSLFGPPSASPGQLATTLAQLSALFGSDRVGSPKPIDAHRPERFGLEEYHPPPAPLLPPSVQPQPAMTAIRVIRPAMLLAVSVSDAWPWEPVRIQTVGSGSIHVQGAVRFAAGPWKMEDVWWDPRGTSREYWDVELVSGGLLRIYQDLVNKKWLIDGLYD
jgi:hypothetical protein